MESADNNIQVGFVYTYKGHNYLVTKYEPGKHLVKDDSDGNWHNAVSYVSAEDGHAVDKQLTRKADDFAAKFILAEGEGVEEDNEEGTIG